MSLVQGCKALVYTKLQLSLVTGQKELPGGPCDPSPPLLMTLLMDPLTFYVPGICSQSCTNVYPTPTYAAGEQRGAWPSGRAERGT